MKILVVFTGGTIGSTLNDGYISTDTQKKRMLIDLYQKTHNDDVIFEIEEPYTILSENLEFENFYLLEKCIRKNLDKGYDAIIVTHGTDTIQYTAAMLGYTLNNIHIPILLVSSNYTLDREDANGLDNFSYSVEFAKKKYGNGVFVTYRNDDGLIYIHNGTRLLPHTIYRDNLYSVQNLYYGYFNNTSFVKNEKYVNNDCEHITLTIPEHYHKHNVLVLNPKPGCVYPTLDENIDAILYTTYHSGTINSTSSRMITFFQSAIQKNIPVFLIGAGVGDDYETVKVFSEYHINVLPISSPIAMYVKLWLLVINDYEPTTYAVKNISNDII